MGSLAALMVAELGVILYVAKLGDPHSILAGITNPWRVMATVWLVGVVGLLTVGSFLALRAAVTSPNAALDPSSQLIVIAAVMSGVAALIVAPLWGFARELKPFGSLLLVLLSTAAAVTAVISAFSGGAAAFAIFIGLLAALLILVAAFATAIELLVRFASRGSPPEQPHGFDFEASGDQGDGSSTPDHEG
jgi:hypothetical protein